MSIGATGGQKRSHKGKSDSHADGFRWPPEEDAEVVDLAGTTPEAEVIERARDPTATAKDPEAQLARGSQEPENVLEHRRRPTAVVRLERWAKRLASRAALPYVALVALGGVAATEGVFLLRQNTPWGSADPVGKPIGTSGLLNPPARPAASSAPALDSGRLAVRTQPAGAAVIVDGQRRGLAPVIVSDLPAGDHEVVVATRHGRLQQSVRVGPGETTTLVVPLAAVPPAGTQPMPRQAEGFVGVKAPFELQVLEDERPVGTSATPRLALAAGRHTLTLRNGALGFEDERRVTVSPGRTTTVTIANPTQRVAVNAVPWAEVWADGRRLGETPLGTLDLAVGPHVLVFRHPELGEKTLRVTVRGDEPARVSVDMRK